MGKIRLFNPLAYLLDISLFLKLIFLRFCNAPFSFQILKQLPPLFWGVTLGVSKPFGLERFKGIKKDWRYGLGLFKVSVPRRQMTCKKPFCFRAMGLGQNASLSVLMPTLISNCIFFTLFNFHSHINK